MQSIYPHELDRRTLYKLMTGVVVPRPIAWVSTINRDGQSNLAPFSYFNIACVHPPTLLFCPNRRADGSKKHTLLNIEAVPEFVIHIVSEDLAAAMNITSGEYPPDVDEFAIADLHVAPSHTVAPPRIADAVAAFECKLTQIVPVGDGEIVLGEAQVIHFRDGVYQNTYVLLDQLAPVGRLAGSGYIRCTDTFEMKRPVVPRNDL